MGAVHRDLAASEIGGAGEHGPPGRIATQPAEADHPDVAHGDPCQQGQSPLSGDAGTVIRAGGRPKALPVETERLAALAEPRGPAPAGGRDRGEQAPVGQALLDHRRVVELLRHRRGGARSPVVGCPRLLHDQDVGVEGGALRHHIERAPPPAAAHVDVEGGEGECRPDQVVDHQGQWRPMVAATAASSSRKSGWARPIMASARSRSVRPERSALPYSVTMTATWWRGVETTDPSGRSGTILERAASLDTAVERRQISEWSSRRISAPATKSSWPPTPEICLPSMWSATTCPYRSTLSPPLIDTKALFLAISVGSLTTSTGRKATCSLPSSQAYSSAEPRAKVVTDTPSNRPLASLVTLPAWCSFIRPSVNISLWTPYPPPGLSASLEATMLGTAPMPIWRVAPSVMYERAWVAMASSISSVGASGRVKGCARFSTTTSTRSRGRVLVYFGGSDAVRGRLGLTSMINRRSGSRPASISSFMDPPTASERLTVRSASPGRSSPAARTVAGWGPSGGTRPAPGRCWPPGPASPARPARRSRTGRSRWGGPAPGRTRGGARRRTAGPPSRHVRPGR